MCRFLMIIVLAFILTQVSCTQEYICQCVVKYTGNPPSLPDSSVHEFAIKDVKKNAKAACEANSLTSTTSGVTATEKCQLY